MSPRWSRRLYVVLFLVVAFLFGSGVQEQLGISFTIEGLEEFRLWVQGLGWGGPAVYILLCIFRLFIGLSSHLVLILGGLTFGIAGGMLWGSLGLVLSAMVLYFLARLLGTSWVERRFSDQYKVMLDRIQRFGAIAIFAVTAHPIGLLTPAHLVGGLVGMKVTHFLLAVALAAPIRTAPFVILGTAVLDLSGTQALAVTAVLLLVVFVVPLLSPKVREWVWGAKD